MPDGITVDIEGIREIEQEFRLLPVELNRALERAARRTMLKLRRQIARQFVAASGLQPKGGRIRVRGSGGREEARLWGGLDPVLADYIPGAVTESKGPDGRTQYYVLGKLIEGGFRASRGPVGGRGRIRRRTGEGQSSELVRVSISQYLLAAWNTALAQAPGELLHQFRLAARQQVLRSRV